MTNNLGAVILRLTASLQASLRLFLIPSHFLVALPLVIISPISHADSASKTGAWLMSLTRIKLSEQVNSYIDIQPRFTTNTADGAEANGLDTLILRGALGYQITPNIGLYQGYAYIPTYHPKNVEHRSFQELLITQAMQGDNSLMHRLRFEQRFIDSADEAAYRLRYFMRYTHPLTHWHPQLSLALNEEIFFNLNDVNKGPQAGVNQNRLFAGFSFRTSKQLSYDLGYQNQWVNVTNGRENTINHILFFGMTSAF